MTKTLNQLTEITTLADDDLLLARDVSAVEDFKITLANLKETSGINQRTIYVGSVSGLASEQSPTGGQAAVLTAERAGVWSFSESDLSAEVNGDPDRYQYIAPTADESGASGAWVREISSKLRSADLQDLSSMGPSLVGKLLVGVRTRGMYIREVSGGDIGIGIGLNDDLMSVVEYRLRYDADNLLLLRGVLSGVEDQTANGVRASLSGSYNTNSAPLTFTTTIGDTWNASFTGQSFYFRTRTEDRGGLWELTLQPLGIKKRISCYDTEAGGISEFLVFDNLPYGDYRVEAEFLGDDPINPASDGTPRGYVAYDPNDADVYAIRYGKVRPINGSTAENIVSPNSIPDFAIRARPAGASYGSNWVPAHSSDVGAAANIHMKLIVDGLNAIQSPPVGEPLPPEYANYREIEDVELIQRFEAYNSSGSDGPMWLHYLRHTLTSKAPVMTFQSRLEVLQETRFSQIYFGMLPSEQAAADRLVFDDGTEINTLPSDGSEGTFGWGIRSAMYAGEYKPGNFHAAAVEVTSLREGAALGGPYQEEVPGRITYRMDGVTKVYWSAGANQDIPAETVIKGEHKIAAVSGIRFPSEAAMFI